MNIPALKRGLDVIFILDSVSKGASSFSLFVLVTDDSEFFAKLSNQYKVIDNRTSPLIQRFIT